MINNIYTTIIIKRIDSIVLQMCSRYISDLDIGILNRDCISYSIYDLGCRNVGIGPTGIFQSDLDLVPETKIYINAIYILL